MNFLAMNIPYMGSNLRAGPWAHLDDGNVDLVYQRYQRPKVVDGTAVDGGRHISKWELLKIYLSAAGWWRAAGGADGVVGIGGAEGIGGVEGGDLSKTMGGAGYEKVTEFTIQVDRRPTDPSPRLRLDVDGRYYHVSSDIVRGSVMPGRCSVVC